MHTHVHTYTQNACIDIHNRGGALRQNKRSLTFLRNFNSFMHVFDKCG